SQANATETTEQSKACVLPLPPNCTDIYRNQPLPNPVDALTRPDPTSPLPPSTPSANQFQAPPQAPALQSMAGRQIEAPFLGEFFGGALIRTSTLGTTNGMWAVSLVDPSGNSVPANAGFYVRLDTLGGNTTPQQFQTTGDIFQVVNGVVTNPVGNNAV